MSTKKYFIYNGENELGPFNKSQLKSEHLDRNTQVWHEGLNEWKNISEISELQDLLRPTPKTENPPPKRNKPQTTKPLSFLLIGIGICLIAAFFNNTTQGEGSSLVAEPEDTTVEWQAEQARLKDEQLTAKNMNYRNNWPQYIKASHGSYYSHDILGGITGLTVKVNNTTDYILDQVTVEVEYIKLNGGLYKAEHVSLFGIKPNEAMQVNAPDSDRGTSVRIKIVEVMSKKMHFCYPINNGNMNDPWFCK